MRNASTTALALCIVAGGASAGGIDRSGQSIAPLFQEGNYAEISLGTAVPSVSGSVVGIQSGDMADTYWQFGAAMKQQINDRLSYAIILDQPFGANVAYSASTGYPLRGTYAELQSTALTGVLRYNMDNGFGVHGGLRVQRVTANASVPTVSAYSVDGQADYGTGYLAGVSYERPDIALRVSLTYNSKIKTEHRTSENLALAATSLVTKTTIETPQSVNLDFQTGIAKDTLLFGGVRWVDWSDFTIDPLLYRTATRVPFLSYEDDTYTYTLGVGRRITDTWSGSLALTYEDGDSNKPVSNLGPTSGKIGVTVGARYKTDNFSVSTGVNYTWIGNATTNVPIAAGPPPVLARSSFSDNTAIGFGVKVGWHY
ncbi:OmpP1/FadL family transporter [Roseovarius sp.]|jgi:long-subunit fatty acid transport protein